MIKKPLEVSIGIIAYNEEANIENLISAFLKQDLDKVAIKEIIVVSSACHDNTDKIVEKLIKQFPILTLIKQKEREGKSSAINLFLQKASADNCLISSADVIPENNVVEQLISAFENEKIGASGGRPMPVNSRKTLIGFCVHTLWEMHHEMALVTPKLGEMIAFRRIFDSIPTESAVDEASIEQKIKEKNLDKIYIPNAVIHNKGPENFHDYKIQRIRIAIGHLWLAKYWKYHVASGNSLLLLKLFLKQLAKHPLSLHKICLTIFLEIYCRLIAKIKFTLTKQNPTIWEIAKSTKNLQTNYEDN